MIRNNSLEISDLNLTNNAIGVSTDQLLVHITIFTSVLLGILCSFGCVANILNMVVFMKIGFKDPINVSLFGLTVSDFGSGLTSILYAITINPLIRSYFPVDINVSAVAIMSLTYPHIICVKITILITCFIVFERCLCVALPMKVKLLITPRRSKQVVIFIYVSMILSHVPVYYSYRLGWVFDPITNTSTYARELGPKGLLVGYIFLYIQIVFHLGGPYIFITICTVILLANLIAKAKWRRMATKIQSDKQTNSTSTKDKKVAILVLFISGLFIVCSFPILWITIAVLFEHEMRAKGGLNRLYIILHLVNFITEGINATFNIVIYYNTSSKYKTTFNQIFTSQRKD